MCARTVAIAVVLCWASAASADLASEEKSFGVWGFNQMREIHRRTCTCKPDGDCTLKVSLDEVRAQLTKFAESVNPMAQKSWPILWKKMSAMSESDSHAYGQVVGKRHVDSLPKDEVAKWTRMIQSCWGASSEPATSAKQPDPDAAHDGSLDASGKTDDLNDGKLDEASAIAAFMKSCRASGGGESIAAYCGCVSDFLRQSPPSTIRVVVSATGDDIQALPGVAKCTKWFEGGARKAHPFAKKRMKPSLAIEAAFNRCRATPKGKPDDTGVVHCNRHVALH